MQGKIIATTRTAASSRYDHIAKEFIEIIRRNNIRDQELSLFLDIRAMTQHMTGHVPNRRSAPFLRAVIMPSAVAGISWTAFCFFTGATPAVPLLFTAGASLLICALLFSGAALLRRHRHQLLFRIVQGIISIVQEKNGYHKNIAPTPHRTYRSAVRQIKALSSAWELVLQDDIQRMELKQAILRADRALSLEQLKVLLHDCRLE